MENSARFGTVLWGQLAAPGCLAFPPLTFLEDGDEVTVGRPDQDEYIVLPADAAALLRQLNDGSSIQDAAAWYARKYGEPIDVHSFVAELGELGFIRRSGEPVTAPAPVRWQRLGTWVFSPISAACYCVLLAGWLVASIRTPRLIPHPANLFYTHYMSVMVSTLFLTQMPLVLLHEAAHTLAARRLGLRSRLSIGRRFYFLVFQTTMNGLVSVPRSKRYVPILAGILFDLAVVAALSLTADFLRSGNGSFGLAARYCLAVAYITSLRLLWQLWFFLQTDIYYLVVTVFSCIDLQGTAKQQLRNRLNKALGRTPKYDPASWHPRDNSVAQWYSWVILGGYTACLVSLMFAVLPASYRLFANVFRALAQHGHHNTASIVDSAVLLTLTTGELALVAALYLRERKGRPTAGAPQSTTA
ncbi:MAG TPA: PqqD family protein [Jatrophihabitans sp.]|nr:PqqD family protein [Jatrophihabitans sp.]